MTKKQREKIVHEACELLERRRCGHACGAIDTTCGEFLSVPRLRYSYFFWNVAGRVSLMFGNSYEEENRSARIISLLLFHEAYESVFGNQAAE